MERGEIEGRERGEEEEGGREREIDMDKECVCFRGEIEARNKKVTHRYK